MKEHLQSEDTVIAQKEMAGLTTPLEVWEDKKNEKRCQCLQQLASESMFCTLGMLSSSVMESYF